MISQVIFSKMQKRKFSFNPRPSATSTTESINKTLFLRLETKKSPVEIYLKCQTEPPNRTLQCSVYRRSLARRSSIRRTALSSTEMTMLSPIGPGRKWRLTGHCRHHPAENGAHMAVDVRTGRRITTGSNSNTGSTAMESTGRVSISKRSSDVLRYCTVLYV